MAEKAKTQQSNSFSLQLTFNTQLPHADKSVSALVHFLPGSKSIHLRCLDFYIHLNT